MGIPAESTSFVDRRHELAEVKRVLSIARLVTLTGPAGVGKTRLATHAARSVASAFPDGVCLVSLDALPDGALVPHAVADALGVRDEAGRAPLDGIVARLRGQQLLLVLDNCEHLLDACAGLIVALLTAEENLRVLTTSRHELRVAGEHLLEVPPLGTPDPRTPLGGRAVVDFPALTLFAERAAAVVPGFQITAENLDSVARLCRRLDGLPLAIELAAVRLRVLGVEQLIERLDDRYRLLTAGGSTPPRHQTLRAAVDWSHDLCTPQEQRAWARLSVFAGSFDLDAATAICADIGDGDGDVLDAVIGLLEKSILIRENTRRTVRYRLLAVLRQYGQEKLAAAGEEAEARRRHREHFLRVASDSQLRWFGPDQADIVVRLQAEYENLRAALEFCRTTPGDAETGLQLLGLLWFYWVGGPWSEAVYWSRRLHERADAVARGERRARWAAGVMAAIRSRTSALLIVGVPSERAVPEGRLPMVRPLAEIVADSIEGADPALTVHVLSRVEIALTFTTWGWPERAVPVCAEALIVCEQFGEQWARSYLLRALALAELALGDADHASRRAEQCLRLEYVRQDRPSTGWTLELLALLEAGRGAPEQAAVLQGAAGRIWQECGNGPLVAHELAGRSRLCEQAARAHLDDDAFRTAYRRGYDLTPQDAIAFASTGRQAPATHPERGPAPRSHRPGGPLTSREIQVARLIAQGLTNRQIATALVIGPRTVESHVEHILTKLAFTSRSQVAAWVASQSA